MKVISGDEPEHLHERDVMEATHPFVKCVKTALKAMGSSFDADRLVLHDHQYGVTVVIEGQGTLWRNAFYYSGHHKIEATKAEREKSASDLATKLDSIGRNADVIEAMHRQNMLSAEGMGFEIVESGAIHIWFSGPADGMTIQQVSSRLWAKVVGDGYCEEIREYITSGSSSGAGGWSGLKPAAARHRHRVQMISEGKTHLMIEACLANALNGVDRCQFDQFEALLRESPKGPTYGGGVWSRDRLIKEGVMLPDTVEAVSVTNGLFHGRLRLGDKTTWNNGKLLHGSSILPETIICSLPGKPLRNLIEHPLLDGDATIRSIKIDGRGEVRTYVETKSLRYAEAGKPVA